MKITDVKAMILQYKYQNGLADAQNYMSIRSAVIVKVFTDEGITGIGESACFGGPASVTKFVIEQELKPIVVGEDPLKIERIWRKIFERTHAHGRGGIVYSCMSGIDIALWDIMGKTAGLPVYKLLGGYTDRILPYASSGFYAQGKDIDALANDVEEYFKQGFQYVKIKIGRNPSVLLSPLPNMEFSERCNYSLEEDMERVRRCCEIAKKYNGRIMVDVNNSWNVFTAMEMCRKMQDMGVYWVEEPLRPDNLDDSRDMVAALDMAVAGYESECGGFFRFKDMIDKHAVDIVQCDVIWTGGFTECRRIANYALGHCLPVIPHVFSTALCLVANLHFLCGIPNGGILEYDRNPFPLRDELFTEEIGMAEDGYVHVPEKPGLGVELREDTVEKYLVAE